MSEENIETPKLPAKRVRKPKKTGLISAKLISDIITKSLDEDQAEDVISIDLESKSSIADIMIVASGRSGRHVSALADHIISKLKDAGAGKIKVEGLTNADWVLIDAGD
ncbi:MAG: ribosome silencing factor, partial [Pseudomonadota bacterium]